jgi:sulfur-oxidizing protein SoxA
MTAANFSVSASAVSFRAALAAYRNLPREFMPTRGATIVLAVGAWMATALAASATEFPLSERRSGYEQMSPELKAMQDDDTSNPGMLWVFDGEGLWNRKAGEANRACADCHGAAQESMKGVAARYPAFDEGGGTAFDLEGRINSCRTEHQKAPALPAESKELLALSAFIARQSHGMPIESSNPRLQSIIENGRKLFPQRQGQLNLACVQCHDDNIGRKLAGIEMPQAHPTGYPLYRLEWQSLGSLHRRLRNCMIGMRAEIYAYGSPEYVALETFLMWRARGMPLESPAVRP